MESGKRLAIDSMRTSRIFADQSLTSGDTVTLSAETSHYILRVLRLRPGNSLILFNGDGGEYQATLGESPSMRAVVSVGEANRPRRESGLRILLGQGVSRGERMDLVLQKSVELGVACVAPLWTQRSQVQLSGKRLENRLAHWRGVMRSACEQSGRVLLPELEDIAPLSEWLRLEQERKTHHKLVLDPSGSLSLKELEPRANVSVLIGPEGGLAEDEIGLAESCGFQRIRLGPRVLRTETAAIAMLAALQALWGDLTA